MQSLRKLTTLFRLLGWLVIIAVICVQGIERSGLSTRWVKHWLGARLGPLGAQVQLAEVEVRWLDPAIIFRGFALEDDGELLSADELRLSFGLTLESGLEVRRVELEGGHVRYSPALVHSLRGLFDLAPEGIAAPGTRSGPRPLASMRVRDLAFSLEVPTGDVIELGVLALDLDGHSTEDASVRARFELPTRDGFVAPEVRVLGRAEPGGRLVLESWAEGLDLAAWQVPELPALQLLAELQPQGTLSLSSNGVISLTGSEEPRGELRVSLVGGAAALPFEEQHLEDLGLELHLAYTPDHDEDLWSPGAWAGRGELDGSWESHRFQGGLRLGGWSTPGTLFEQWMELEALPLGDPLLRLLGSPRELDVVGNAIDAEGHAKLTVAVRCFDSWSPPDDLLPHLETIAVFGDAGDVHASWMGWPRQLGRRPFGFPLPADVTRARGVFARTPKHARKNYVGLTVQGHHAGGPFDLAFYTWSPRIDMPPFAQGFGRMEADLLIESTGLTIDDDLRAAVAELGDIEPALTAWNDYAPAGGVAAGWLRVSVRAEHPHPVVKLRVELEDVSLTPRLFPVELQDVSGELHVLTDGDDEVAVRFVADGSMDGGGRARLSARIRSASGVDVDPLPLAFEVAQLRAESVAFDGPVRSVLDSQLEGVAQVLADYDPRGSADLYATLVRRRGTQIREFEFRITPRGDVSVTPSVFPVRADRVHGRVFVSAHAPIDPKHEPTVTTRVTPLRGEWPSHITVSFRGEFPSSGLGEFSLRGAGIRFFAQEEGEVRPTAFLRQIDRELARSGGVSIIETAEQESISLLGNIDFETVVELSEPADEVAPGRHRFFLRGGELAVGEAFQLDAINGQIDVDRGVVQDGELRALFANTEVTAEHIQLLRADGGFRLDLDFKAESVPLDAQHLAILLDEGTRKALFDELMWRGRLDVPGAHLVLSWHPDGRRETRLTGDLTLSDCYLDLGLPMSVRSAHGRVENLVLDEAGVRGWGRIEDLYGEIAERDIGPASMLISYHGSRLTIDEFEGTFERGRVSSLTDSSRENSRPTPVLAVDLVDPFPFLLAIELQRVDVARVLEGVFASNIADRGDLNAWLRLSGRLSDPLSLEGSGAGELTQTRLWSVPVFRDLFSQLGYDATAVFDSMSCEFQLQDGSVDLEQINVHSPLFSLEGDGMLDLDGSLRMDLEIRYALVDKVKVLTALVYLIQNTLLEIAIRGDLSRPQVYLQGALTRLFQDVDGHPQGLPIPRQSRLPARF